MSRTLLVIDIQNDYFPGGVLPLHQAEEIETSVVDAIDQARQAGARIVLVRHVSPAPTGLFAANGTGNTIRPKVLAAAGDAPVVIKQFADAFQKTDLAKVLEGTTELLVCGMMTQNCVVFTAMSRAADSLDVTVIGDLCTGPSEIVHNTALNALGSKLRLKTADEIWT
ncbi:isochorismatase family protein [Roseibium polysiphoniae]|uniref:Isochorismatase family protein n=1 Tax=Roseibium polysiphoniae TaxID=2571221 RepID=A0ABR9C4Q7_9HYPH|nr:isochorismatase family protein [Roseibium polysiphoniae]MBD8874831.1 isochorismatase family protein [Roseibium polysiphoniae]